MLDKGDVKGAVDAALAHAGPEGFVLAAKATTLGAALVSEEQQKALLEKSLMYAQKAIELNANSAEAYFERARAGAQLMPFKGIFDGLALASEVKSDLGRTIELNPRHAAAYVALGQWNAEVSLFAGGNKAQVQPNFEKAIQLEPQMVKHRLEYAQALMKVNRRNKPSAVAVLERAVVLPARTFWEQRDLEAARRLLAELKR